MDIFSLLDEVQSIARNGLHFTSEQYDRERYEQLMKLTTQTYSELLELPDMTIKKRFSNELGYITPKVGANAAIFNENGEILLMERVDGSGWCLPCGWVEPNEKPINTVKREVREETGLDVKANQLVGVFTCMPSSENGPHTMIAIVHLCEIIGGSLTLSHEGLTLKYWPIDKMQHWHKTHHLYARKSYEMWKSEHLLPAVSD